MPKKIYVGVDAGRGLPSGYTELAYIQSSGTQYINTGFVPNNNTKAVCDAELLSGTNDISVPFGTYESGSNRFALMYHHQLGWTHWVGGASGQCSGAQLGRHTFTLTGTSLTVDSATKTFTTAAFTGSVPMFIFGINYTGNLDYAASMRLYSCKIYDNGTLVRDFIPCKNASSTVGLYDAVNKTFYTNAGTGTFTAGATVPVGGVAREVKKPYFGVSNVARKVKNGYIGVDGVARMFFQSGIPIGELDVGTSVWMDVNGVSTEFIIVNQGIPSNSSLYDASCNGSWLLMKDIYTTMSHVVGNSNVLYSNSNIHTYLNSTFLNLLDTKVQAQIKNVKIPHITNMTSASIASGTNGLSTQIFLLSSYEAGFTMYTSSDGMYGDGACLSYFSGTAKTDSKRIAYLNGTATNWWLRSIDCNGDTGYRGYYWMVRNNGARIETYPSGTHGVRPVMVFNPETPVNPDTFEILT